VTGPALARQIQKVDHVGLAVPRVADAVPLVRDVLGARFLAGGDNHTTGARLVHFALPGFKIELLEPLRADSLLAEHIARRGPGFHHLTFLVDDVPTTVDRLTDAGLTTVGTSAGHPRWSETYLSPKDTFGALLQFVSTTLRWDVPTDEYTVDDVLAGRVVWRDWISCLEGDPGAAGTP
jgi:methylmalonyl-CoA/ethylmalonyl-CoA epimerase